MEDHAFIFSPGEWIGEGYITLSVSPEKIPFYTIWVIKEMENGAIACFQDVEMQGVKDHVRNAYKFFDRTDEGFQVELKNELMGEAIGKGILDDKTIGWEFHEGGALEGYEVYHLQDNGEYTLHAEYASTEQYRNTIEGRIWKKATL